MTQARGPGFPRAVLGGVALVLLSGLLPGETPAPQKVGPPARPAQVTAVRFASHLDYTRLVVDLREQPGEIQAEGAFPGPVAIPAAPVSAPSIDTLRLRAIPVLPALPIAVGAMLEPDSSKAAAQPPPAAVSSARTAAETSAVSGVVLDPSGAVVSGASVWLGSGRRPGPSGTTDAEGTFRFEGLLPGTYEIRVEHSGFKTARSSARAGGRPAAGLRITLSIADLQESVTVGGDAGNVQPDTAANADILRFDRRALDSLPVLGNDPVSVARESLDAASTGSAGATLIVDGMETKKTGVSVSAIQEVRINQNPYSAEFSRPGYGRIEIITKAGSSAYHGTVNFAFRDHRLDARNAFAVERPPEQHRQVEGNVSGPVGKSKKTSFLISGQRQEEDLQAILFAQTAADSIRDNVAHPVRNTFLSSRINRQVGKNHTLSFRYELEQLSERNQGVGGFVLPQAGADSEYTGHHIYYSHRAVVTPKLINDFSLRAGTQDGLMRSRFPGLRKIVVVDSFTAGGAQADSHGTEHHVRLAEMLSWSGGRHLVKAGLSIPELSRHGTSDRTNFGGTFEFSTLDDYNLGRPFSFVQQQGDGRLVFWQKELGLFVQDDIRLRPDLSIALGLRYDWQNYLADHNNLAPRFSFAFAPKGNRRAVLRGGAGVFYDRTGEDPIADLLRLDGRRLRRIVLSNPGYPDPYSGSAAISAPPTSIVRFAPDLRSPYSLQYSLGVETRLQKSSTLTATYIGTRGIKLFRSRDVNAPLPPLYQGRPDPSIGILRQVESSARLQSHALKVGFRGSLTRFFNGTVEYTLGQARNNTQGIGSFPADHYDLSGEWALADFDRRHGFSAYGTLAVGKLFKLGLVSSVRSGSPYSLTTGRDDNRDSFAHDRPAGVARNTLLGPGSARLDLRWSREWFLSPRRKEKGPAATLGLDAFNAFNRVNYSSVVGNLSSPFFGRPVASRPARRLQVSFGLKY